jgi:hypothetical protein
VDPAKRDALARAKERLDRFAFYPQPVSLRGVRVWIAPWLFRLPWFRRDDDLVAHELCHVWQMQHHPVRMPLSYLLLGYDRNPYEDEARRAAAPS